MAIHHKKLTQDFSKQEKKVKIYLVLT